MSIFNEGAMVIKKDGSKFQSVFVSKIRLATKEEILTELLLE